MKNASWAASTFWMYTVLVEEEEFGIDSRQVMRLLASQRIQSRPLWQPIHRSPAHRSKEPIAMPVADSLAQKGLSLPCSVGLTESEQDRVIAALREIAGGIIPSVTNCRETSIS
jgi:perosamine synthetase